IKFKPKSVPFNVPSLSNSNSVSVEPQSESYLFFPERPNATYGPAPRKKLPAFCTGNLATKLTVTSNHIVFCVKEPNSLSINSAPFPCNDTPGWIENQSVAIGASKKAVTWKLVELFVW